MIITPDALKALMTGFRKNYQDGLQIAKSQYKDIATVVPSSTKSNTYGWLGQWPGFREWVGDRAFNDMAAHSYAADGGGSTQCWWGDCYAVPSSDGNFMTERALSAFLVIDADVAQYDTGYIPLPLAEKMTSSKPAGGVTFRQVGKQINVEIECESSFTANKVTALCTTVPLRYRTARLTEMKGIAVGAAGIIGGIFAGATHLSVNMLSETSYVAGNFGWTAINSN